ncbi:MAG TPA: hypothetical protein VF174_14510 [Micromonosporaceae bacterium]
METLIVVAAHGTQYVEQCLQSLDGHRVMVVETGESGPVPGRHPTGAYLWAVGQYPADRYLFIQDSMTCLTADPVGWFEQQWPGSGAVAWGRFPMQWDGPRQEQWVRAQYPGVETSHGIMGPIFYTDRASLNLLAERGLLPAIPTDRIEAQGTERAWAYAYTAAGLPVAGPEWNHAQMQVDWGGWRKVWAGRP